MRELSKKEMTMIEGGANGILVGAVASAIITFIVGVLHGYANPKECNN